MVFCYFLLLLFNYTHYVVSLFSQTTFTNFFWSVTLTFLKYFVHFQLKSKNFKHVTNKLNKRLLTLRKMSFTVRYHFFRFFNGTLYVASLFSQTTVAKSFDPFVYHFENMSYFFLSISRIYKHVSSKLNKRTSTLSKMSFTARYHFWGKTYELIRIAYHVCIVCFSLQVWIVL